MSMYLKNKQQLFGIGLYLLYKTLIFFGISKKLYKLNKNLNISEFLDLQIDNFLKKTFIVDIKLRDKIFIDIRKLHILHTYKGFRHRFFLAVRGQRTKTNSRTTKNQNPKKTNLKYKKK